MARRLQSVERQLDHKPDTRAVRKVFGIQARNELLVEDYDAEPDEVRHTHGAVLPCLLPGW